LAQRSNHTKPESSGNRYKYDRYKSGNSTLSDAADVNYDRKIDNNRDDRIDNFKRKKDSSPRDKRNRYNKDNDDRNNERYTKNDKHSENYFHVDKSGRTLWDGKHWNADEFPLKVYVKETSSRYYKSDYKEFVSYAFKVWDKADTRIDYTFVNNSRDADISIIFVENLGKKYDENYLGLTEYDIGRKNEIEYSKIQISLLKFGSDKVTDGEIKATIIHELGHAFGLGHSDSERDIMYPYILSSHTAEMHYNELSHGDKEAVKVVIDLGDSELYAWK
jgi:predicted Zn-dependent protease